MAQRCLRCVIGVETKCLVQRYLEYQSRASYLFTFHGMRCVFSTASGKDGRKDFLAGYAKSRNENENGLRGGSGS